MRKLLLIAACFVFLAISAAAISDDITQQDDSIFEMKQAGAKLQSALHSKNRTHTKSAVSYILSSLKTLLKHNSCYHMVSTLITQLESINSQFDALSILGLQHTLDIANRDCFPIVNFARKLINRAAKALNSTQRPLSKLRGNKLVSFDVDSTTTAGKAVLIIEDAMRFGECFYATGAFGIFAFALSNMKDMSFKLYLSYLESLYGLHMVDGCREAVSLAREVFSQAHKEHKALSEINKISTALFAEDLEKDDMDKSKSTIQGALKALSDLGFADLCTKEFDATLYESFLSLYLFPEVDLALYIQFLLSLPHSYNHDCLPLVNALKYAAVEIGNKFFGLNNTYVPREGGVLKMSDFGISRNSTLGAALSTFSTGLDAWRCFFASATAYKLGGLTLDAWSRGGGASDFFEMTVLHTLAGGQSCLNVYDAVSQLIGEAKKKI